MSALFDLDVEFELATYAFRDHRAVAVIEVLPQVQARAPMTLALVLDRSSSMKGAKIDAVRRAALEILDAMEDEDELSLWVFDEHLEEKLGRTKLDPGARRAFRGVIEGIVPGYGTDLAAAAVRPLADARRPGDAVLLVSDGFPYFGVVEPEAIVRSVAEASTDGILCTVGFGEDADPWMLRAMAQAGGGRYSQLSLQGDLSLTIASELGTLRRTVSSPVEVSLRARPGVAHRLVSPFPATSTPGELVAKLPALADEPVRLVVELRWDEGVEVPLAMAVARARGRDGVERRREVAVSPTFASKRTLDEQTAVPVALARIGAALHAASLDLDTPLPELAKRLREELALALGPATLAGVEHDVEIARARDLVEALAVELERDHQPDPAAVVVAAEAVVGRRDPEVGEGERSRTSSFISDSQIEGRTWLGPRGR